jgi:glycosyltransferase involved in cell wall biosynthesis
MRLAVVSGFPPDPYGEAHYAGQVFRSLARQFADIDILVCAHKNDSAPAQLSEFPNLTVQRITQPANRLQATAALVPLLSQVVRFRPDVVHFQGTHTPRYGGLFGEPITLLIGILRLMGIRTVFTAHSIWLPSELANLWRHKKICGFAAKFLTWLYGANLRFVSRWSSLLSFVVAGDASPMVGIYQKSYYLNPSKVISEVHPCTYVPVSGEQQIRAKKALGLSEYTIAAAIGFIRPDKGYHLILDCAGELLSKFPNLVFIIAGMPQGLEGQNYAEILKQKRLAIPDNERIILKTEYLNDSDFSTYIEAVDLIIVPYLQVSGPSGPIHHALGHGKPVIASALGHNLGLDGICKLVPPGDPRALVQALDELLSDPQKLELYRNRSTAYASRHTWDDLARQYVEQYRKLVGPGCSDQDGST